MFGFKITSYDHGGDMGCAAIKVINDDGIELSYCKTDEGMSFEVVEFFDRFHLVGVFDMKIKRWIDHDGTEVDEPNLWNEEYFQVVDKMIAHLNKGPQSL